MTTPPHDFFTPKAVQYRTASSVTSGQMVRVSGSGNQYTLPAGSYMLQLAKTGSVRVRLYMQDGASAAVAVSDIPATVVGWASAAPVNISSTGSTKIWCYADGPHAAANLAEIRVIYVADPA